MQTYAEIRHQWHILQVTRINLLSELGAPFSISHLTMPMLDQPACTELFAREHQISLMTLLACAAHWAAFQCLAWGQAA